jgi:hypothetical protein
MHLQARLADSERIHVEVAFDHGLQYVVVLQQLDEMA